MIQLIKGDCLIEMQNIPDKSIDMKPFLKIAREVISESKPRIIIAFKAICDIILLAVVYLYVSHVLSLILGANTLILAFIRGVWKQREQQNKIFDDL